MTVVCGSRSKQKAFSLSSFSDTPVLVFFFFVAVLCQIKGLPFYSRFAEYFMMSRCGTCRVLFRASSRGHVASLRGGAARCLNAGPAPRSWEKLPDGGASVFLTRCRAVRGHFVGNPRISADEGRRPVVSFPCPGFARISCRGEAERASFFFREVS